MSLQSQNKVSSTIIHSYPRSVASDTSPRHTRRDDTSYYSVHTFTPRATTCSRARMFHPFAAGPPQTTRMTTVPTCQPATLKQKQGSRQPSSVCTLGQRPATPPTPPHGLDDGANNEGRLLGSDHGRAVCNTRIRIEIHTDAPSGGVLDPTPASASLIMTPYRRRLARQHVSGANMPGQCEHTRLPHRNEWG